MFCHFLKNSCSVTDEQTLQSKHHGCKPIIMVANIISWISKTRPLLNRNRNCQGTFSFSNPDQATNLNKFIVGQPEKT